MIDQDEAKSFFKAAQNVARHYSVETTQKTIDWISFVGVTAGIYGTRVAAISMKKQGKRGPAEVVDFPGAHFTGGQGAEMWQGDPPAAE